VGLFIYFLAHPLQFQIQFPVEVDTVPGSIVPVPLQPAPETVLLADPATGVAKENLLMVTVQPVGCSSDNAILFRLQNTIRH
jgi:hypothetical protein